MKPPSSLRSISHATKTSEALEATREAVAKAQRLIALATFSHVYGRAATSAAFRKAKELCIIEVRYESMVGTPVYQPFGMNAALAEAQDATKH